MTIKIESVINQWDSETDQVIVRFLNLLTLAIQGAVSETSVVGMGKPSPLGSATLSLQRKHSRQEITDS